MTETDSTKIERTVVVAIDSTEASMHALREAREITQGLGGRVVTVFVRHIPAASGDPMAEQGVALLMESLDETEDDVKKAVEAEFSQSSVPCIYVIREGDPAHEILTVAHDYEASFIVVGATIHGAISSILVSSVAEHLLHHSDVSLIVVRPEKTKE